MYSVLRIMSTHATMFLQRMHNPLSRIFRPTTCLFYTTPHFSSPSLHFLSDSWNPNATQLKRKYKFRRSKEAIKKIQQPSGLDHHHHHLNEYGIIHPSGKIRQVGHLIMEQRPVRTDRTYKYIYIVYTSGSFLLSMSLLGKCLDRIQISVCLLRGQKQHFLLHSQLIINFSYVFFKRGVIECGKRSRVL